MAVLISDSFNRVDSTTSLGSTDSYNGGTATAWAVSSGAWGISGNRAYYVNVTGTSIAYMNSGIVDHTVSCVLNGAISGNYRQPLIVFRMLNATNYLYVRLEGFQMSLRKVDGGVTTQLATYSKAYADSTDYTIKVVCSGNNITVYDGATSVITYTLSGSDTKYAGSTYTYVGISQVSFSTNAIVTKFDNFQVEGITEGTDVSYAYATKQSIYADRTVQASTKQSIYTDRSDAYSTEQSIYADRQTQYPTKQAFYADRQAEFATKQAVYADRSFSYATRQAIYADVSYQFATRQNIYSDYVLFSASFPLKQIIYADRSVPSAMKQSIYADKTYVFATTQRFYDPSMTIIGRIQLEGQCELYVYLVGERELTVSLEGGIDLKTNQNFSMVSGDSKFIDIPIASVDLTGANAVKWIMHAYGTVKVSKDLTAGITVTNAATGTVQIKLEPVDTAALVGDFSHELEVTDSVGNVSTVLTGRASITKGYIN